MKDWKSCGQLLAVLLVPGWVVTAALAQAEGALEVVEVSATRKAAPDSSVSFSNIAMGDITYQQQGQEPAFLLQATPSIGSYSDAGSYQGYAYMRLRGMDQTRINMTLNGVPLNEPEDQGVYFSNYSGFLANVADVQIQRGTGIAQHGTASYAGSVQFTSKRPASQASAEVAVNLASFATQQAQLDINSGQHQGLAARFNFQRQSTDGYKHRSANDSQSGFGSLSWEQGANFWMLTAFSGEQRNQMAWLGTTREQISLDRRANANALENDQFRQQLVMLNNEHWVSERLSISSAVYANWLNGNYDFDLNNFLGLPVTSEMYNYHFDSTFYGGFSNLAMTSSLGETLLGLHINDYQREHLGSERMAGELYRNTGYKDSASVYVKHRAQWHSIGLEAALQHRTTTFRYRGNTAMDNQTWRFINPFVGATYRFNSAVSLYASAGKTGREPTRNDMFGGADDLVLAADGSPALYTLDPEYVANYELGLRYATAQASVRMNGFYMRFDDELTLAGQLGPNGLPLTQGVESSFRRGLEFEGDLVHSAWRLALSASLSEGEIREQGEVFSHLYLPRWVLQPSLRYDFGNWFGYVEIRYQSAAYIDFANANTLPGHVMSNLKLGYEVSEFSFVLHVNNVTNEKYFGNATVDFMGDNRYFVAAPRNMALTMSYRW